MTENHLSSYVNGGWRSVLGWGLNDSLCQTLLLINEFQREHNITGPSCEIGVHNGLLLILLGLMQNDGETAIGIDLFEMSQDQNLDKSGSGSLELTQQNIKIHAPNNKFELVAANSFNIPLDVLKMMHGTRLFHVDGGHFLEVVLADIATAQTALGVGGVIIIDDFWTPGYPEVHEATIRYLDSAIVLKAVPLMVGWGKIFLAHLSHKDRLLNFIKQRLPDNYRQWPIKISRYDCIEVSDYKTLG
jgi:hypothetical protein